MRVFVKTDGGRVKCLILFQHQAVYIDYDLNSDKYETVVTLQNDLIGDKIVS